MAGVRVLEPILDELNADNDVEQVIRASWFMDVNPVRGKEAMKAALDKYGGANLMRLVLASHLLWRVFWHHYKTAGAAHFISSAQRSLAPLGLQPPAKRIEAVKKGVSSVSAQSSGGRADLR